MALTSASGITRDPSAVKADLHTCLYEAWRARTGATEARDGGYPLIAEARDGLASYWLAAARIKREAGETVPDYAEGLLVLVGEVLT